MNQTEHTRQRLQFLSRVLKRECTHLSETSDRLFSQSFSKERAAALPTDSLLSERVEAFVSRFSRLQDTLGDKLIPQLLRALGENPATVMDNLDKAESLGWITSAEDWQAIRQLRNQMIHDYIEDPVILCSAIQAAQGFVPKLIATSEKLQKELCSRGYLDSQ